MAAGLGIDKGSRRLFVSWIGLKTWESGRDGVKSGRPKYFGPKSCLGPSGRVEAARSLQNDFLPSKTFSTIFITISKRFTDFGCDWTWMDLIVAGLGSLDS